MVEQNILSVIVPVYNAAKYLERCIDSISNQSISNIEIICINDGSIDTSLEILKEFANADTRIRIINQPNQGVSAARNAGLKAVQGKYVCFVDADFCLSHSAPFERASESDRLLGYQTVGVPICTGQFFL